MAASRICSVPDCGKPHHGHGYCMVHAARFRRHGDPLKTVQAADGEPMRFYQEVVLAYEGDDCLTWPYGKCNGYGTLFHDGQARIVSRMVCEEKNGPPPGEGYDAAHSCGNGHLACVTKGHVSWKTRSDNIADMVGHGTARRGDKSPLAKLSEGDVRRIRALRGSMSHGAIANLFGVSRTVVTRIYSGDRWGWLE